MYTTKMNFGQKIRQYFTDHAMEIACGLVTVNPNPDVNMYEMAEMFRK